MKKPKRTDEGYLRGWFLVEAKGNHRLARDLVRNYLRERKK